MTTNWTCPQCGATDFWKRYDALGEVYCGFCDWNKVPPSLLRAANEVLDKDKKREDESYDDSD